MFNQNRLKELQNKGYCCSQIILKMGMEDAGFMENPALVQAAAGLCGGLHSGLVCGILSGAACLFALCQPEDAADLSRKLVEWFKDDFKGPGGSIDCVDILDNDEMNRLLKCPNMLLATYEKAVELLEENGCEIEVNE